jgi:hypothetical protein
MTGVPFAAMAELCFMYNSKQFICADAAKMWGMM